MLAASSNSNISWIGSVQGFLLGATTVFTGPLVDIGHARLLATAGSFLVVLGFMMTSLCSEYWQFVLAQAILIGVGSGCLFITAVGIVPSYFTTKKSTAVGFMASGSSTGGVIYPIIFNQLQQRIGFPWTARVMGFLALLTLTFSCSAIKVRTLPRYRRSLIDATALKEPPFDVFGLSSFFGVIGLYIPFFYLQESSHIRNDLDTSLSFYELSILNAGSFFGRVIPGLIADRLGPLNVLMFCNAIAGLLAFCWIAIRHSPAGIIVFAILYGFASGAFVAMQSPSVVQVTKSRDMGHIGSRIGTNTLCNSFGVLIGNPLAGLILKHSGWTALQAFAGATILAAAGLVAVTHVLNKGWQSR